MIAQRGGRAQGEGCRRRGASGLRAGATAWPRRLPLQRQDRSGTKPAAREPAGRAGNRRGAIKAARGRRTEKEAMRLETLLPLGKVDPGLRAPQTGLDLAAVAADAALIEEIGYDGVAIEETKQDPYIVLALAAPATTRLRLSTAIAMAFPRSPTITAMSAWTLQRLAKGRFTLGLGPQVRAHIERRYGLAWSPPAPWMREYVAAVRAVWRCWQQQVPLEVKGPHYRLNLMPPL